MHVQHAGTYTFYCTVHRQRNDRHDHRERQWDDHDHDHHAHDDDHHDNPDDAREPPSGSPASRRPIASLQSARRLRQRLARHLQSRRRRPPGDRCIREERVPGQGQAFDTVRVGHLVRSSVSAGKMSFVVKLNASARRALKRHHRLALTVKITLTPFYAANRSASPAPWSSTREAIMRLRPRRSHEVAQALSAGGRAGLGLTSRRFRRSRARAPQHLGIQRTRPDGVATITGRLRRPRSVLAEQ